MNRPESVTQVHLTGGARAAIRPDAAKSNKPSQEIPVARPDKRGHREISHEHSQEMDGIPRVDAYVMNL
jgi:hypothetical protein